MTPTHQAWLDALKLADRGGIDARLDNIVPGLPWSVTVDFAADYSADAFACALGFEPDNGASETNDVSVAVGAYSGGKTVITLSLNSTQTAALATYLNADGVVEMLWDLRRTPSGQGQYMILGGWLRLVGAVGNV